MKKYNRRCKLKYFTVITNFTFFIILCSLQTSTTSARDNNYQMKLGTPLPANQFIELAKKINPAVVSISTTTRPQYVNPFFEHLLKFYGFNQRRQPQKKQLAAKRHIIGTGFIIDSSGLILTNSHVIRAAKMPEVQLIGEEKYYPTKVIGDDPRFDIALIKIEGQLPPNLQYAKLGDSDKVQVGEWVAAFGNPFGHSFSVSKGIISAKQRHIDSLGPVAFLQTDASINPGNSGGPLVNMQGEVIGVNTAIDARAQGIGFAIPINVVKEIKPQLEKLGYVERGYLGVGIDSISGRAMQALNLSDQSGALVLEIYKGSPADKAGIRTYDVIKKFNQTEIKTPNDLINAVRDYDIGKLATIQLIRQGKNQSLKVKVGTNSQEPTHVSKTDQKPKTKKGLEAPHQLGFTLSNFSEGLAREYGIINSPFQRPIVSHVTYDSVAWKGGMRKGDLILDVNRKSASSLARSVFSNLKQGQNILRVFNKGKISLIFLDIQ